MLWERSLRKTSYISSIRKNENILSSLLNKWISDYRNQCITGLEAKKNKSYTIEFKWHVIHTLDKQKLSLYEACLKFNIPSVSVIIKCQKDFATALYHKLCK